MLLVSYCLIRLNIVAKSLPKGRKRLPGASCLRGQILLARGSQHTYIGLLFQSPSTSAISLKRKDLFRRNIGFQELEHIFSLLGLFAFAAFLEGFPV